eukprot:Sspe_Gene.18425::Locus_6609_Transcript_1_1_Confidence_1.000_Length_3119::g.18425::m.18425
MSRYIPLGSAMFSICFTALYPMLVMAPRSSLCSRSWSTFPPAQRRGRKALRRVTCGSRLIAPAPHLTPPLLQGGALWCTVARCGAAVRCSLSLRQQPAEPHLGVGVGVAMAQQGIVIQGTRRQAPPCLVPCTLHQTIAS